MHLVTTPHGFVITAPTFLPVAADEFERVLRQPASIAGWNDLTLTEPERGDIPLDMGDPMEFIVRVGPLSFSYIMIVACRHPGASFTQRTTKGFMDVTIKYTWEARDGGTQVVVEVTFRQTGSRRWKMPMTRLVARRFLQRNIRNMRDTFSPRRAHQG